jgi:hypothetical protein
MPELGELLQEAQEMYCHPSLGATLKIQHSFYKRPAFTFPKFEFEEDEYGRITSFRPIPGTTGAILVFGHMQKESTKFDYGGFQFPHIRWDELCNFTESQYLFMMSRNRSKLDPENPKNNIPANIRSTGNPIGTGRSWVKRRFIDQLDIEEVGAFRRIEGRDTRFPIGTAKTKTRMFIPGFRDENMYVGDDYEDGLEQLDPEAHRALALGDWNDYDAQDQLIKTSWVNFATKGEDITPVTVDYRGQFCLGVDAAELGDDMAVICTGFENQPRRLWGHRQTSGQDLAWLVDQEAKKYPKVHMIGIDSIGVGTSASNFLEGGGDNIPLRMKGVRGLKVSITNRSAQLYRCASKDPNWDEKFRGDRKFKNFRAQAYWKLREDFENGKIDLSYLAKKAIRETAAGMGGHSQGDFYEMLLEELTSIRYSIDDQGWVLIQSKAELRKQENLGRSPDAMDALVYWNWVREREAQCNSPEEMATHPAEVVDAHYEKTQGNGSDYVSVL